MLPGDLQIRSRCVQKHCTITTSSEKKYLKCRPKSGSLVILECDDAVCTPDTSIRSESVHAKWIEMTEWFHRRECKVWLQLRVHGGPIYPKRKMDVTDPRDAVWMCRLQNPLDQLGLFDTNCSSGFSEDEARRCIENAAAVAKFAVKQAGFDGVEIRDGSGWSISGNLFVQELVEKIALTVGADRTGIMLRRWSTDFNTFDESDQSAESNRYNNSKVDFKVVIEKLKELNIAFVHFEVDDEAPITLESALEWWGKRKHAFVTRLVMTIDMAKSMPMGECQGYKVGVVSDDQPKQDDGEKIKIEKMEIGSEFRLKRGRLFQNISGAA